ncbi:expressed unknown protein [Seminavis robusta]|uniref:Uncharacterized protein n=1 Tax=Seminavis robusta TaxID=568900 RepID=A0A9N8EHY3_9STRA|nr:expressed unknown protein [Seminavis robusta]|eukprot:Sro1194_g251250.1 n/a (105) ;mRNA; r:5771-6183
MDEALNDIAVSLSLLAVLVCRHGPELFRSQAKLLSHVFLLGATATAALERGIREDIVRKQEDVKNITQSVYLKFLESNNRKRKAHAAEAEALRAPVRDDIQAAM